MTTCVCPACGFAGSLLVFTNDVDARHVAALMAKIPPEIAEPLSRYLAMFAPAKHKLTWPRLRKLLQQLLPDIERRAIEHAKRQWPVSLELWAQGLEQMHEGRARLSLPLKSHGYLYKILAGGANKAEAAAEQTVEAQRRAGQRATETAASSTDHRELQIRTVVANVRSRLRSAAELGRPASLEDIANSYRDQFGAVVVDAALIRLQTPVQQEQQHG